MEVLFRLNPSDLFADPEEANTRGVYSFPAVNNQHADKANQAFIRMISLWLTDQVYIRTGVKESWKESFT